ncbi:MAG: glycosyltransferase family 4 protein, partial [Jiangellales bacterium]
MPALRVLMVSWEFPPVMYGGLGRHVHALSAGLVAAGHEVVVLAQAPAGTAATQSGSATTPRVVRAVLPPDAPDVYRDTADFIRLLQPALADAAAEHLGGFTPDLVHGHDWVVAQAAASVADRAGVRLVATVHATESGLYGGHVDTPFSRWRHGTERELVDRAARTIVCSSAMRDEVVTALDAEASRVVVVPNGVDPAAWSSTAQRRVDARTALGLADTPMIVLVGRLEHEKGAQDALDALPLLTGEHTAPHLVLVGDGSRADDLRAQVARLGLSHRVHMTGRLTDRAVADLVGAADLALVPSRYEPFGLVALEAMAAGTAVVATTIGGLRDVVVDGVTGLAVPAADPVALAGAMRRLLDDPV